MLIRARFCAAITAAALVGAGFGGCGEEDEPAPDPEPLTPAIGTPSDGEQADRKAKRAEERLEESLENAEEDTEDGSGVLNY
jgi:hypothetical protein